MTSRTTAGGNAAATNTSAGTNTGDILSQTTAGGSGTVTNAGTNTGNLGADTTGGSGTVTNTGHNGDAIEVEVHSGGNALVTNSGSNAHQITAATDAGGNATIVNSGSNGDFLAAATATTGDATVTNSGTTGSFIQTTANNGNATTTNSGSNGGAITTQAVTGNATTTNSGSNGGNISTQAATGNATTTNSGSNAGNISTLTLTGNAMTTNSGALVGAIGTSAGTGNATTINSGSAAGMTTEVVTGNATTVNSGASSADITTTTGHGNATTINSGTAASSIFTITLNGSALLVNSGIARDGVTVVATNGNATLTNSGTIAVRFGTIAVQFAGTGPDTVNILPGSTIIGQIHLDGVNDTVNFSTGNQNLTFNTLAGAHVTSTLPFVVSGNQAVTVDPTPFAMADKTLMDFTRAISGLLDGIGGGVGPSGSPASAFAPIGGIAGTVDGIFAGFGSNPALGYADASAPVFKAPSMVASDGRAIWARGFGGERNQDPQDGLLGAKTTFFGGAVGFDLLARTDLRLGVFVGGGESRLTLDGNNGFTNSDTAFGGIYGRWGFVSLGHASFLDFALHGGGSTNSTSRTVNNNLAPGGIELATANYSSSYISPELKYGIDVPLWAQYTLTPSLRVRYVAGFFGGYTESGTTAPLTVAGRTIQDIEERGELKLTRATPVGPDLLLTSVHIGAIGIERLGDTTVNTTILGVGLPFVTPGRNQVAGVVGGAGFEWRTREGVSFFAAGEGIGFSDQSTVWSAKGGVRVAF
ncbi:MAG TPA: autotransporter domain-containing protein [Xanthobacteraceae bacterium]